jgi:cell division initiation protein
VADLTPLDIQQQHFRTRFRGFDTRQVASFLDRIAAAFESLLTRNENLSEELSRLHQEIEGHQNREDAFKRALLNSQRVIDQMKKNAQKSAELIVAQAEVKAEKILNKAHNRLAQLHEDIAELKRQRVQLEVQIGAVLEAHGKLLEISKDAGRALDDEDAKVRLLQQNKA